MLAGFGTIYVGILQQIVSELLQKREFDPIKKQKLIEIADAYANSRIATIAWLAQFMPELALFGATIEIILSTPNGEPHHASVGHPGDGEDHTRKKADGDGAAPGDHGSPEPGVQVRADFSVVE